MILLGVDLETGGSFNDPLESNFITEIGAVLYDNGPVEILSYLIKNDQRIVADAELYTGISDAQTDKYGVSIDKAISEFKILVDKCDAIVAHNGLAFDKPILDRFVDTSKKVWIDTVIDIDYPANVKNRNLTYLQAWHGFVYPGHRAIFDVMAMIRILESYDIHKIFSMAQSPLVLVRALTGYHEREKPKSKGFSWNPDSKYWEKNIRELKLEEEILSYDFKIVRQK